MASDIANDMEWKNTCFDDDYPLINYNTSDTINKQ